MARILPEAASRTRLWDPVTPPVKVLVPAPEPLIVEFAVSDTASARVMPLSICSVPPFRVAVRPFRALLLLASSVPAVMVNVPVRAAVLSALSFSTAPDRLRA